MFVSSQVDELRCNRPSRHVEQQHRVGRSPPPLGGAAWIQDPDVTVSRHLRLVRMAVDNGIAVLKPAGQALCAPTRWARVVRHPDARFPYLDDTTAREELLQLVVVHVPVDGFERPERAQLGEDPRLHEVARVEDQLRALEIGKALGGDPARSARKVRVGDDRDERQAPGVVFFFFGTGFALGSPTLKAPPTRVIVRRGFISAARRMAKT